MKLKVGTEGQRVGLFLGVDMRSFTHRSQKIASPSTAKHTEIQYNSSTEIQSKGSRTVGSPKAPGAAAASIAARGRNPPNAGKRPELHHCPADCGDPAIG